jgi:hypothetical protein
VVDAFHCGYNFNNFGVHDHVYTQNNLHTKWYAVASSALVNAPGNVTIWMRLIYIINPNKQDTKRKEKVAGATFRRIVSLFTCKLMIIYKSLLPKCFGRLLATNYVWWLAN